MRMTEGHMSGFYIIIDVIDIELHNLVKSCTNTKDGILVKINNI